MIMINYTCTTTEYHEGNESQHTHTQANRGELRQNIRHTIQQTAAKANELITSKEREHLA